MDVVYFKESSFFCVCFISLIQSHSMFLVHYKRVLRTH